MTYRTARYRRHNWALFRAYLCMAAAVVGVPATGAVIHLTTRSLL